MDVVALSLFVVLELAALLGVVIFVLNRKRKQLQAQVQSLTENAEKSSPEDFDSKHWQHATDLFTPPEAPETEPELVETVEEETSDENSLSKALTRIRRLEKFRDNFFDMKKRLKELEDSKQKLVFQLEALIPEAERSEELLALLDTMNAQRDRLEAELAQLESQSDELAKAGPEKTASEDDSISELETQVSQQKKKMSELHHLVDSLNLEAENTAALQTELDKVDLSNRDMNMCIQVLEEENQFLQEQIKTLLQADEKDSIYDSDKPENNDSELQQEVETMKTALDEKDQQIRTLQDKYDAMESEYLTLYEEANS
ncbi:hypothetical protein MNBD_GAMMA15-1209 [hydrothermal vent metagenome]|uniref:Uncharacterized protein n=1 Tax=hydrothermal vent metagenome TaxID=652676 RepID=A0A3B0ZFH1_9ZZZZ